MEKINSVAIRSSFKHHAEHAGYKQILKYTKPVAVFGIDERNATPSLLRQKYQWLYEFDANRFIKSHKVDLLHILYGENYFRFSSVLINKKIPLVITYHQPPHILKREIEFGDTKGRVAGWAHKFTKKRFANVDSVIVMTEEQKQILKKVIDSEKIDVVPFGVDVLTLKEKSQLNSRDRFLKKQIITVGNWLRDWDFYFRFVEYCSLKRPDWNFVLVCKNLPENYKSKLYLYPNLNYNGAVSDNELIALYTESRLQFLPVIDTAGNNSVLESFALACPLVITEVETNKNYVNQDFMRTYKKNSLEMAEYEVSYFMDIQKEAFKTVENSATDYALRNDWSVIGTKTLEIYQKAIERKNKNLKN